MTALEGVRVLDLSRVLAGPYCTQILADLGAEVWKVEPPWGDETRKWGPPFAKGESGYYLSTNRGKKSLSIDLKNPKGQVLIRELAGKADVLLENFKVGDLARYGLDDKRLRERYPRLIYASLTGFGQTGPRAAEPGYDAALQGLTGLMSITGEPAGPPAKVGVAWIDILTGQMAAIGILAALYERERSGLGQRLDLSLFDVGLAAMVNQAQSYLLTGTPPDRMGHAHPQIVPYQAFEATDGWFMVAVGNDNQYRRMTDALDCHELWEDGRLKTNAGRVALRHELIPRLETIFRRQPREVWLARLRAAGVPVAPVNNLAEAFADPQAKARGLLWEVAHPKLGEIPLVASPLQGMSRTPAVSQGPPPLLGEHSREVLRGVLGLSEHELDALEANNIVRRHTE